MLSLLKGGSFTYENKGRIKFQKMKVETLEQKHEELTNEELSQVIGGAMIVNHNMAANNTLTQLSKNQSSLDQS